MTASGSYNISTKNQYISGYVEWTESNVNVANNTSSLTMNVYLHRTNTYSGTPTKINNVNLTRTFYIGSSTISSTEKETITIPNDKSYVLVASTTKSNIAHNSNGSLSLSIGFEMSPSTGTTGFTVSRQNSTATLTTIPRTSKLNSVSINLTTNKISYNMTRYSSSFTDNLTIYSGNNSFTLNKVVTSATETLNSSQLNTLYSMIGTNLNATINAYVRTYNGSTLIGTSNVVAIPISLPNYTLNWSTHTCVDSITNYDNYKVNASDLIANISKPTLTFSAVSSTGSNYGRTIGYTINGGNYTSPTTISNYTGQSFTIKASDGRTSKDITWTATNTVVPYTNPTLSCTLQRLSPTSDKATVTLRGTYYDGAGLTNLEQLALSFVYTERGENPITINYFTINETLNNHVVSFTATATIEDLTYTKSISFTADMEDLIGNSPSSINDSIPQGLPVWNAYLDNNNVNHFNVNGIFDSLYYKSGDTYQTASNHLVFAGYVTASGTSIRFTIPLPKRLDFVSSVTVSVLTVDVRSNGGYVPANEMSHNFLTDSNLSQVAYYMKENLLGLRIEGINAWSGATNNHPVTVNGFITVTFN